MKNAYMTDEEIRRLKSYVVGAGYTVSSLADKIGMSRVSLSSRVNGKIDFGRTEMNAIARVLEKKPEEIFFTNMVT